MISKTRKRQILRQKWVRDHVLKEIVTERVRIWNEVFKASSIKPWQDGEKLSQIISIGEPKLRSIILPDNLPEGFEITGPIAQIEAPKHPSLNPLGKQAQLDAQRKNQIDGILVDG